MSSSSASEGSRSASPQFRSRQVTPDSASDCDSTIDNSLPNTQYVLITGGLGFIGSHTALELLKEGYNVIIVDDLSNSYHDVFDNILQAAQLHRDRLSRPMPKAKFVHMDYRNASALSSLLGSFSSSSSPKKSAISGVIHFAAFKQVEESIRKPLSYYQNNIGGLVDLLALLDDFNIKTFVFSSSASVYGSLAEHEPTIHEESCRPFEDPNLAASDKPTSSSASITNPYGRTKFFGEAILADLARSDPSWTILALRYFNPIGCDQSGLLLEDPRVPPSNLVPVAVKVLTGQQEELSIYGDDWATADGTAVRDFIHVTDVARGHVAALEAAWEGRVNNPFRVFNLGTGEGHSVREIVGCLEKVSGRGIRRRVVGRRDGDVGACVASADRAERELGWKTEKSLKDACEDLWRVVGVK